MTAIELSLKYRTLLKNNKVDTPLRLAHFFAQIDAESNLKPQAENLNYSKDALRRVFFKYFPNDTIASQYARKPEKIANKVYANRMGNCSEQSGDGWKYRGRGFIQVTGKNNYTKLSIDTGIDYVRDPDLLLREADAMISALWYWTTNNLNKYADRDNLDKVSDIINIGRPTEKYGDAHGFSRRREGLVKYKKTFGVY